MKWRKKQKKIIQSKIYQLRKLFRVNELSWKNADKNSFSIAC